MIHKGSYKLEPFLQGISRRLDPGARPFNQSEHHDLNDDIWYFGSGYWRGIPVRDENDKAVGVRLVNPDRTQAEIEIVEQALAILMHLDR